MKEEYAVSVSKNKNVDYVELYEKYSQRIMDASLRYSDKDKALAEDAMQVAFIELFVKMSKNEEVHDCYNFLYTTAKNYTINYVKHQTKIMLSEDVEDDSNSKSSYISSEDEYLKNIEDRVNRETVRLILQTVKFKNPKWYYIIIQVFLNGRSQKEVAREMHTSDEAIYAMINRIRTWAKKNKIQFLEEIQEIQE